MTPPSPIYTIETEHQKSCLSDKSQGQGHLALVEIQVPIWTLQRDISEV
jgi:hypothetical protein